MKLYTLKSYIDDIMLTVRNNNISESEDLSYRQIELWIHAYRALLIKQDIDKGRDVNNSYVQVKEYDLKEDNYFKIPITNEVSVTTHYVTTEEIPKPLDLHDGPCILSVTDLYNGMIQKMSPLRYNFQKHRKFTKNDYTWHYEKDKIHVEGMGLLKRIRVRMVLENPTDLMEDVNQPYPLPVNMWPTLKKLIMQNEFGVMLTLPSDDQNSNTLKGVKPVNNE